MPFKVTSQKIAAFATSFRSFGERITVTSLIFLSVALLILAKVDIKVVNLANQRMVDLAVPALELVREPLDFVADGARRVGEVLAVFRENERLRAENERLLAWQNEAIRLAVQNRSLRQMLHMPLREPAASWTTARLVGDSTSPFVHTRLLDAGHAQEVEPGMAVVNPLGLVGRVIAVGERSSRVILLTDFNSRIPVVVERSGDQALLEGDNTPTPKLRFLPLNPGFTVGDRVLTSGNGGLLPAGLLIGEIAKIDGNEIAVRPYVDWQRLDYVSVLRQHPLPPPDGDAGP